MVWGFMNHGPEPLSDMLWNWYDLFNFALFLKNLKISNSLRIRKSETIYIARGSFIDELTHMLESNGAKYADVVLLNQMAARWINISYLGNSEWNCFAYACFSCVWNL